MPSPGSKAIFFSTCLSSIFQIIAKSPKKYGISIEGHTDDVPLSGRGRHKSNWDLINILKNQQGKNKVLVIDVAEEFFGVVGDKLSAMAEKAKYEAMIINGYVRDSMETKKFNIGLFALENGASRRPSLLCRQQDIPRLLFYHSHPTGQTTGPCHCG